MFSGFDFKRFSLDALQDEEEAAEGNAAEVAVPPQPQQAPQPQPAATEVSSSKKLPPLDEEQNEWDWDQDSTAESKPVSNASASHQRHDEETHPEQPGNSLASTSADPGPGPGMSLGTLAVKESSSLAGEGVPRGQEGGDAYDNPPAVAEVFQETSGGFPADSPAVTEREERAPQLQGPQEPQCHGKPIEEGDDAGQDKGGTTPTSLKACGEPETSEPNGVDLALVGSATMVAVDRNSAGTTASDGASESPKHADGHGESRIQRQHATSSAQEPIGDSVGEHETLKGPPVDAQALIAMREELEIVKNSAAGLEGALRESRSEVMQLREKLATEEDTSRRQAGKIASLSDEVNATRTGFQESNAAHQRTAERSHAFEEELHRTRQVVDSLHAESAALKTQVNEAAEDRQALEGQLRQLQAGLTEGQEAARQEGRQEAERLEARLKELLKDRDRKQAELDLQNARRKETREMARDLESQLAAVERIAQEREVELTKLKDEMLALRKNTGEATDQKNTWATKYEALERNFKQVRAESKRAESELDEVRQYATRIEAEKAVLEERVEVEGAERVTVVASVSHERDFLLRQVDRLEQELTELRRSQEAEANAAAARAQTTGVLEEYRTRAQQALKRANEITSQTASENKRLEAEMSKLAAEVDQQRPLWEQSKQLEEVHRAEVAELEDNLASKTAELENKAAAMTALEGRLAEEEEERRNAHTSVMRLEAQAKSLKQELHRQQKALAAAQENTATLEARLVDQEAALQAAESRQSGKLSPEGAEDTAATGKYPASPQLSMGWEEEKQASRSGTPRNGAGIEATGAGWADRRRSLGESVSSMPSEGDSVDASQGNVGEQLFYVHQLRERMSKEQIEMRSLISELEASRTAADAQAAKQAQLEKQLEAALLDIKRLQDLDSGRNAAINLTYLKNCVVGCLRTSEPSEHARLLPVITTILKLSEEEAAVIAKNISMRAQHQGSFGGGDLVGGGGTNTTSRSWWSSSLQKK